MTGLQTPAKLPAQTELQTPTKPSRLWSPPCSNRRRAIALVAGAGLKISWSDLPAMPDWHGRPAPHVRAPNLEKLPRCRRDLAG